MFEPLSLQNLRKINYVRIMIFNENQFQFIKIIGKGEFIKQLAAGIDGPILHDLHHEHFSLHTGTVSVPRAWLVCSAPTNQSHPSTAKSHKFIKENALSQGIPVCHKIGLLCIKMNTLQVCLVLCIQSFFRFKLPQSHGKCVQAPSDVSLSTSPMLAK